MSSYDAIPDFGLLYDSVPLYQTRRDVGFYVAEAKSARGPVLELGCGSGRILLPVARAGVPVVGVDNSAAMLDRCRAKLAAEPAALQRRVTLHQQDLGELRVDGTFDLVTAPFRVFQHLTTVDAQLRVLAAVRRHLAPGGRLVFDVFNPRFDVLSSADGTEHEELPRPAPLPDGRTFYRTYRIGRVRWLDQVSETELVYYVGGQRYVQAFEMRWYLRTELEHLLARAGYTVQAMYGDFERGPVVEGCPELIVVAARIE